MNGEQPKAALCYLSAYVVIVSHTILLSYKCICFGCNSAFNFIHCTSAREFGSGYCLYPSNVLCVPRLIRSKLRGCAVAMPAQPAPREAEEEMETEPDSEVPHANGETEEEREREGGEAEETMEESGEERESDLEESEAEEEEEEEEESSGMFITIGYSLCKSCEGSFPD